MENKVLLRFDKSCKPFRYLLRDKYAYPIVYEDGLVSRLRSSAKGRKAWGYLINGYIVAISRPERMTYSEAREYCNKMTFAGMPCVIPPRGILKKIIVNLPIVNNLISELGGMLFEGEWYMAENDRFCVDITGKLDARACVLHPSEPISVGASFIEEDVKAAFYPAVKIQ